MMSIINDHMLKQRIRLKPQEETTAENRPRDSDKRLQQRPDKGYPSTTYVKLKLLTGDGIGEKETHVDTLNLPAA